jgi:site-specific DNA-methyltransferase (cytosine-N4-specific)
VVTTTHHIDPNITLRVGDALGVLAAMPDGSADCIVTSPPYWAKRDYGVAGQYGHEASPAAYVATLVAGVPPGPPRPGR